MFLSDVTIKQFINKGLINIEPSVDIKNIRPAGIRIHLGKEILLYKDGQVVDPQSSTDIKYEKIDIEKSPFILKPNQLVIGHTCEKIKTPRDILGFLDGRSTIARLGLPTHVTPAVI